MKAESMRAARQDNELCRNVTMYENSQSLIKKMKGNKNENPLCEQ